MFAPKVSRSPARFYIRSRPEPRDSASLDQRLSTHTSDQDRQKERSGALGHVGLTGPLPPPLPPVSPLPLLRPLLLQTKLRIGALTDPLESEADHVADQVMRMSLTNVPSSAPGQIQRKCAACQTEEQEPASAAPVQIRRKCAHCEEEEKLRPKASGVSSYSTQSLHSEAPPLVHQVLRSPGQPLAADDLAFFTPRFGFDFSRVRIHNDRTAAESAHSVNALAYAAGSDIAFSSGQYQPGTDTGRRLLAHELAHVVQQGSAPRASGGSALWVNASPAGGSVVQRETPKGEVQAPSGGTTDAGGGAAKSNEAGAGQGVQQRICGPDITTSLTTMLGTVEPWFRGLTGFQQSRSCTALGPGGFLVGVNPGMAWDTRELFLPNTGWLDAYFRRGSCGSPRDPGCDTDPQRHLCEKDGTCGNSVVVDSKCMLAGTANYALFGKMCRVCHDYTQQWNRWDMRATIGAWKTIDWDDSTPPKEVASAAYDGTFPTVPTAAANRGTCTGRCGLTSGGTFDFIWEPYKPR